MTGSWKWLTISLWCKLFSVWIPKLQLCHNRYISNNLHCWLHVCLPVHISFTCPVNPSWRGFPLARCWITSQTYVRSDCHESICGVDDWLGHMVFVYFACDSPVKKNGTPVWGLGQLWHFSVTYRNGLWCAPSSPNAWWLKVRSFFITYLRLRSNMLILII